MCQTDFYGFLKPYPAAGVWSLRPLLYRTSPGYSFLWGHSVPLRSSTFQHHTAYRPRSYSGWSVDCRCQRNTYTECHTGSQGDSSGPRGRGRSSGHWCSVHSSTHQCTDHKIPSLKTNISNLPWVKVPIHFARFQICMPKYQCKGSIQCSLKSLDLDFEVWRGPLRFTLVNDPAAQGVGVVDPLGQ